MMTITDLMSVSADHPAPFTDQQRLAVAAYLARFTGPSREHTASDLCCYLSWCAERGLSQLTARARTWSVEDAWVSGRSGPPAA
jgi:hypothetical protein